MLAHQLAELAVGLLVLDVLGALPGAAYQAVEEIVAVGRRLPLLAQPPGGVAGGGNQGQGRLTLEGRAREERGDLGDQALAMLRDQAQVGTGVLGALPGQGQAVPTRRQVRRGLPRLDRRARR